MTLAGCTTTESPRLKEFEKRLNIMERKIDGVLTDCILEKYSPRDCTVHD